MLWQRRALQVRQGCCARRWQAGSHARARVQRSNRDEQEPEQRKNGRGGEEHFGQTSETGIVLFFFGGGGVFGADRNHSTTMQIRQAQHRLCQYLEPMSLITHSNDFVWPFFASRLLLLLPLRIVVLAASHPVLSRGFLCTLYLPANRAGRKLLPNVWQRFFPRHCCLMTSKRGRTTSNVNKKEATCQQTVGLTLFECSE